MSCPETVPDTLQLRHEDSLQRTANADPPHPQLSLPSVEGRSNEGEEEEWRREGGGGGGTEEGRRRGGEEEVTERISEPEEQSYCRTYQKFPYPKLWRKQLLGTGGELVKLPNRAHPASIC